MGYMEEVKQAEKELSRILALEKGELTEEVEFDETPWDGLEERRDASQQVKTDADLKKGYVDVEARYNKKEIKATPRGYADFYSNMTYWLGAILRERDVAYIRDPNGRLAGDSAKRGEVVGESVKRAVLPIDIIFGDVKKYQQEIDFKNLDDREREHLMGMWVAGVKADLKRAKMDVHRITGKTGSGWMFSMVPSWRDIVERQNGIIGNVARQRAKTETLSLEHDWVVEGLREIREAELTEAGFVIGGSGLEKPSGAKLTLQPNTAYFIGHSTSPNLVIVDRVSKGMVSYHDAHSNRGSSAQDWVFRDLAQRGIETWLRTYAKYQPELARTFRDILAGKKVRPNAADFDRFTVTVQGEGPDDLWRAAEHYGNVAGLTQYQNRFEIELERKALEALKKDKRFKILKTQKEELEEAKRPETIKINGTEHKVLNAYSSGPGAEFHTYDVSGGTVEKIGKNWYFQRHGQTKQKVTVEAMAVGITSYDVKRPEQVIAKVLKMIRQASEEARKYKKKSPEALVPWVRLAKWLVRQDLHLEPKIFAAFRKVAPGDVHKVAKMLRNVPALDAGVTDMPVIVMPRGEETEVDDEVVTEAKQKFKVGDIVRRTAKAMRSMGLVSGPVNGKVVGYEGKWPLIQWSDDHPGEPPMPQAEAGLELDKRAMARMKRHEDLDDGEDGEALDERKAKAKRSPKFMTKKEKKGDAKRKERKYAGQEIQQQLRGESSGRFLEGVRKIAEELDEAMATGKTSYEVRPPTKKGMPRKQRKPSSASQLKSQAMALGKKTLDELIKEGFDPKYTKVVNRYTKGSPASGGNPASFHVTIEAYYPKKVLGSLPPQQAFDAAISRAGWKFEKSTQMGPIYRNIHDPRTEGWPRYNNMGNVTMDFTLFAEKRDLSGWDK